MDYLQKPVTYSKSLVHLSKVSIYVNEHTSAIQMKSPCVIVHKQDFTCMHLADAFIQSDLQYIQAIHFFVSMCVPWELNPQPLRC